MIVYDEVFGAAYGDVYGTAAVGGTETAVEVYGGSTTVDDFVTVGSDMEYSRIAGAISGATQVYGGGTNVDDSADTVFSDSTFEYSRT